MITLGIGVGAKGQLLIGRDFERLIQQVSGHDEKDRGCEGRMRGTLRLRRTTPVVR